MVKFTGIAQNETESFLYYSQKKDNFDFLKIVSSKDGLSFQDNYKYVVITDGMGREDKNYDWKSFKVSKQENQYILTYQSNAPTSPQLSLAISSDLIRWKKIGKLDNLRETGAIVPNYQYEEQYVMYFGEKNIKLAYTTDLQNWQVLDKPILEPRAKYFDDTKLEIGSVYERDGHILLLYYVKDIVDTLEWYVVGAAIFDKKDPTKLLWRSEYPIWQPSIELRQEKMRPLGSALLHNELLLYWLMGEDDIYAVSVPIPHPDLGLKDKIFSTIVKKFEENPLLTPLPHHPWESRAAFNSAAVYEDGKVHFVYRALGDTDLSVLGYAASSDGLHIDERSKEPIYIPREPFETPGGQMFKTFAQHFVSGGGYGGIEDPRITKIGNKMYMTYVAFDGTNHPRVAATSIEVNHFLKQEWDYWEKPRLITAPGIVNKSAVLFPEQVNGKYVMLHRVYPNILIDYLDDLNFDTYLQGHHFIPPRRDFWDSKKVGAGAPPMKTKDGWLLIYQSVGFQDSGRYKIGAMMLDGTNPSKVLYRTPTPIIAPDELYENAGHKAGVVYPCGAVIMNNTLHVYYGGADTVVCAASSDLDTFLQAMKQNRQPRLERINTAMIH